MSDLDRLFDDLPHVSQLVDLIYPFNIDPSFQDAVDKAIDRGKRIHKQIEDYINYQKTGNAKQKRWCRGLEMPINELEFACIIKAITTLVSISKQPLMDVELLPEKTLDNGLYMGTIDLIVEYKSDSGQVEFIDIIDWKTSSSKSRLKANVLQLYFYKQLVLKEYPYLDPDCVKVLPVYLNPNVPYKINDTYEDANSPEVKLKNEGLINTIELATKKYTDLKVEINNNG